MGKEALSGMSMFDKFKDVPVQQKAHRPGDVWFRLISNDAQERRRDHLVDLMQVKVLFSRQLPRMPREYITRLVLDRRHRSLVLKKMEDSGEERVIGGACFYPFFEQKFAEIVFLAVDSREQVRGYGSLVLRRLKNVVKEMGIEVLLTYADNFAVGFFKKQGFVKHVSAQVKSKYQGYIKEYDGGTLMKSRVFPNIDYMRISDLVKSQRAAVEEKLKAFSNAHVVHPGLDVFTKPQCALPASVPGSSPGITAKAAAAAAAAAAASSSTSAPSSSASVSAPLKLNPVTGGVEIMSIPGVRESGYKPPRYRLNRGVDLRPSPLKDLQARFAAVVKAIKQLSDSWPFHEPVNPQQVPNYYKVIKTPMDLSEIQRRIDQQYYMTAEMFRADFVLMLDNCRAFNPPKSLYVRCANSIESHFHSLMKKLVDPLIKGRGLVSP